MKVAQYCSYLFGKSFHIYIDEHEIQIFRPSFSVEWVSLKSVKFSSIREDHSFSVGEFITVGQFITEEMQEQWMTECNST